MEQETLLNQPIPPEKVYLEKQLWLGSYLGGPLVAGYLLARNFKAFGESGKARNVWIVTVAGTVLLFAALMFAPYVDRVPGFLFPLVYTAIASIYFQMTQGKQIAARVAAGAPVYGWGRVVGVAVIGLIVTAAAVVGASLAAGSIASRNDTTKNYGAAQHEITFDKSNINEAEVDKIADALSQVGLMSGENPRYFHVKKSADTYRIAFFIDKTMAKNKPELLAPFAELRDEIQNSFPNNPIIINLVGDDPMMSLSDWNEPFSAIKV